MRSFALLACAKIAEEAVFSRRGANTYRVFAVDSVWNWLTSEAISLRLKNNMEIASLRS